MANPNSRFLYPEAIARASIDIPRSIHNYLKKNPLVFQGQKNPSYIHMPLPKAGRKSSKKSLVAITYDNIEGRNPTEVPLKYLKDDELIQTVEEYPFQNLDAEDQRMADAATVAAIRKIRGPGNYSVRRKEYMINTSTVPIRVYFEKNGKKQRHPIYVKRPDLTRLLGKWVYDIISGHPRRPYMFNRAVFLEDAIPGEVLSKQNEDKLLTKPAYREGLVRASAHASFLDIPDIINSRNRIVANNFNTLLFDFNIMLLGRPKALIDNPFHNILLERYAEKYKTRYPFFGSSKANDIFIDEMKKISRRVKANEDSFFGMVRVMEDVEGIDTFTNRQKAKEKYSTENLEELFRKRLAIC